MLLRPRIIPCLTIDSGDLVKTIHFSNPRYIGDPVNAVKIFNGKGVDELCILDITASKYNKKPNFQLLAEIASEAFIPLSYGGAIRNIEDAREIFKIGFEKVIINTAFFYDKKLIMDIVKFAGSQSVVASFDVKKTSFGKYKCFHTSGTTNSGIHIEEAIRNAYELGVGEIIVNSIDNDGKMIGYDLKLLKIITSLVDIPVIINGGAGSLRDLKTALDLGIHAVAASSLFIYYGPLKAVLITYPTEKELYDIEILK